MLTSAKVAIAQMYRRATHIRRFESAVRAPAKAQEYKLLQIVRANQTRPLGASMASTDSNVDHFQKNVPVSSMKTCTHSIEALMTGAQTVDGGRAVYVRHH